MHHSISCGKTNIWRQELQPF